QFPRRTLLRRELLRPFAFREISLKAAGKLVSPLRLPERAENSGQVEQRAGKLLRILIIENVYPEIAVQHRQLDILLALAKSIAEIVVSLCHDGDLFVGDSRECCTQQFLGFCSLSLANENLGLIDSGGVLLPLRRRV